MIRRLYIDGYKAFVNHTIEFDRLVFLAGGNGTGKSGHFDVLWAVRQVVCEGKNPGVAFPPASFTQFQRRTNGFGGIVIELVYDHPLGDYRYRLIVDKNAENEVSIVSEHLHLDGEPLYVYEDGNLAAGGRGGRVMEAPVSPDRSAMSMFLWETISPRVADFRATVANLLNVQLNPFAIKDAPTSMVPTLDRDGANAVRWLTWATNDFRRAQQIVERWTHALGVPVNFRVEASRLVLELTYGNHVQTASMSDLSEGQRALLIVHALLVIVETSGGVLLLDEPDNYLSYAEVRGLISDVQSASLHARAQIVLASHNPVLMRSLGGVYGYRFYRDPENGHVRYTDLATESEGVYADLVVADGEIGD